MIDTDRFVGGVYAEMVRRADPKKKAWWDRYMRGVVPFLGLGIPTIRDILVAAGEAVGMHRQGFPAIAALSYAFFRRPMAEEKMAGVLVHQLYGLGAAGYEDIVAALSRPFDEKHFFDWNTVDWVGIRLLRTLIDRDGLPAAKRIVRWTDADYLWKARAGLVAFAQVMDMSRYTDLVLPAAERLIRRDERFAKTAVGWTLRELRPHAEALVYRFLDEHGRYITREVIDNILKHVPVTEKQALRSRFTAGCLPGRGRE